MEWRSLRVVCVVGVVWTGLCLAWPAKAETLVKLQGDGFGPGLSGYEEAIVSMALDATKAEFGDYRLENVMLDYNLNRVWRILGAGDQVNIVISSGIMPMQGNDNVEIIELPFLGGALGLRKSVVHKNFREQFELVDSLEKLIALRVGQGSIWQDTAVYLDYGIPLVAAADVNDLYRMLDRSRFDYLPLSVLQVQHTFDELNIAYPDIVLASKTYIYYPIKIWAYVGPGDSELAQRLKTGLSKIFADKSADQYFLNRYGKHIEDIRRDKGKIFILNNPNIEEDENKLLVSEFLKRFNLEKNAIFARKKKSPG